MSHIVHVTKKDVRSFSVTRLQTQASKAAIFSSSKLVASAKILSSTSASSAPKHQVSDTEVPRLLREIAHFAALGRHKVAVQTAKRHNHISLWNAAISACGRNHEPDAALKLLREMIMSGRRSVPAADVVSFNSAISALGRAGRWQEAGRLFDEILSPNSRSAGALLAAYDKGGQPERALTFLKSHPLLMNTICVNTVLSSFSRQKKFDKVLDLYESLQKGVLIAHCRPDTASLNAALKACEQRGDWGRAIELLESAEVGLKNVISWNTVISACGKGGAWERALFLLNQMEKKDAISFSSAITACDRAGRWQEALQVFKNFGGTYVGFGFTMLIWIIC